MLTLIGPELRVSIIFLAILFAGSYAFSADGEKISGQLSYSPSVAMSERAMAEIALVDGSPERGPVKIISAVSLPVERSGELRYQLTFDPKKIDPRKSYKVQAKIVDGAKLTFVSNTSHPVLTNGFSDTADFELTETKSFKVAAATGIYGGSWLVEDINGRGVIDVARSTISFDASGSVSGSGGCNRFKGSAAISSGTVKFGPMAMTRKMCPTAVMDQEAKFMRALSSARSFKIDGSFLRFHDGAGTPLLRLTHL